jgi:DNA polymerase IV
MDLPINRKKPTIMFIDLNSCFASAEQQANPLIRGKPVAVAAYTSPRGCIISPSTEAKQLGIKVGTRVGEAQKIYPGIIILSPDPAKYRDIHIRFKKIFQNYSTTVTPKSIDEAILNFSDNPPALKKGLKNIAKQIKRDMKKQIGDWISCSIGISTHIFLAKLGSEFRKPNGLVTINHKNLLKIYHQIKLTDLYGISHKLQARLNAVNIFTPTDFLRVSVAKLKHQIFHSICGTHWYYRLRGYEANAFDSTRKTFGQSYSLYRQTDDLKILGSMLFKLCEKMGRRLRRNNFAARGIHLALLYSDRSFWHKSHTFHNCCQSTYKLYQRATIIFHQQPKAKSVANISVNCFNLIPHNSSQLTLFDNTEDKNQKTSIALDQINDKYGEFTVSPASLLQIKNTIVDRIAFGGVKDLQNIYQ